MTTTTLTLAAGSPGTEPRRGRLWRLWRSGWPAALAIAAGAAILRLVHVGEVASDPFYDGAVRSMTMSWHNFFFGAMEPGGSVSIDKPPLDLWLQVASVKLFGFGSTTLKLPEAIGGTLSVVALFALVSRVFGALAGLAAALALTVLPIAVITSRSDTMDAVMSALLIVAALMIVKAAEKGSTGWLLGAGAVLGLAFNVKLDESFVALPGLLIMAWMGLPGSRRRRLAQGSLTIVVYVVVSLSWLTATLAFPAHDRPYAFGSSNGSAWNAAFIYNGLERIEGKPEEGGAPIHRAAHYPEATQSERESIPITEPSAARLLTRVGPLSGERLGLEVLVGLIAGALALGALLSGRSGADPFGPDTSGAPTAPSPFTPEIARDAGEGVAPWGPASGPQRSQLAVADRARVQRATIVGLMVWLVLGIVIFSHMARLHPRYTEGFTPAVAATLGIGVAWATARATRARLIALALILAAVVVYAHRLLYGTTTIWWIAAAGAILALAVACLGAALGRPRRRSTARPPQATGPEARSPTPPRRAALALERPALWSGATRAVALALALVCVLAIPLWASTRAVSQNVTSSNSLGVMRPHELKVVSAFLTSHQGHARYEVAYDSASKMGALVVADHRPILVLNTIDGHALVSVARLRGLIAAGEVKYAILTEFCTPETPKTNADCSATADWIRAHGHDISAKVGLGVYEDVLWRLPRRVR